jgi:hypothetical protein
MKKEKKRKIVSFRIETCRRVLISTPLSQLGAGTFENKVKKSKAISVTDLGGP